MIGFVCLLNDVIPNEFAPVEWWKGKRIGGDFTGFLSYNESIPWPYAADLLPQ